MDTVAKSEAVFADNSLMKTDFPAPHSLHYNYKYQNYVMVMAFRAFKIAKVRFTCN